MELDSNEIQDPKQDESYPMYPECEQDGDCFGDDYNVMVELVRQFVDELEFEDRPENMDEVIQQKAEEIHLQASTMDVEYIVSEIKNQLEYSDSEKQTQDFYRDDASTMYDMVEQFVEGLSGNESKEQLDSMIEDEVMEISAAAPLMQQGAIKELILEKIAEGK